jgi:hypothetical protein
MGGMGTVTPASRLRVLCVSDPSVAATITGSTGVYRGLACRNLASLAVGCAGRGL